MTGRFPGVIEFRGVTKQFADGTVAVDNLDLVAENGQITVFVGPSGCGKTTSLRMVNRMTDPTAGNILIDDRDVRSRPRAQLRREIGYVIQQAGLFPHRTVLDNVATVPRLIGWPKRRARTRAAELLELVGLPGNMGARYPAQLSGGQQQRVALARAMVTRPAVLLADEPTGALDRANSREVLARLRAMVDAHRQTVVTVTHDPVVAAVADRVVFLADGQVVDELIAAPRLDAGTIAGRMARLEA